MFSLSLLHDHVDKYSMIDVSDNSPLSIIKWEEGQYYDYSIDLNTANMHVLENIYSRDKSLTSAQINHASNFLVFKEGGNSVKFNSLGCFDREISVLLWIKIAGGSSGSLININETNSSKFSLKYDSVGKFTCKFISKEIFLTNNEINNKWSFIACSKLQSLHLLSVSPFKGKSETNLQNSDISYLTSKECGEADFEIEIGPFDKEIKIQEITILNQFRSQSEIFDFKYRHIDLINHPGVVVYLNSISCLIHRGLFNLAAPSMDFISDMSTDDFHCLVDPTEAFPIQKCSSFDFYFNEENQKCQKRKFIRSAKTEQNLVRSLDVFNILKKRRNDLLEDKVPLIFTLSFYIMIKSDSKFDIYKFIDHNDASNGHYLSTEVLQSKDFNSEGEISQVNNRYIYLQIQNFLGYNNFNQKLEISQYCNNRRWNNMRVYVNLSMEIKYFINEVEFSFDKFSTNDILNNDLEFVIDISKMNIFQFIIRFTQDAYEKDFQAFEKYFLYNLVIMELAQNICFYLRKNI